MAKYVRTVQVVYDDDSKALDGQEARACMMNYCKLADHQAKTTAIPLRRFNMQIVGTLKVLADIICQLD